MHVRYCRSFKRARGGGEIHRSARCDLPGRVRLETVEVPIGYSCEIGCEKGLLCVMDVESLLFEISGVEVWIEARG